MNAQVMSIIGDCNMTNRILQICAVDITAFALLKPMILESVEAGFMVDCACTDTGNFWKMANEKFRVVNIQIERKIRPWSNLQSVWKLYRLMKENQYDLVHVHTPIASVLGRLAAKMAGVPYVIYTAHGFYFHENMKKTEYLFWFIIEWVFGRFLTDYILLQSKEDYQLCLNADFQEKERIIHISNGVDVHRKFYRDLISAEKQNTLRRELGIDPNAIVITFIGRLVREKGIIELIDSFVMLQAKSTKPVVLMVIGELLSTDRDSSESSWREKLQHPSIICTGSRVDIPELLSISHVFVLPSHREGLPRSIIEAMAMNLPIVTTNIRGCREEVFDGENGFLVPVDDANELCEKILQLVEDDQLREEFGNRSRELALDLFDEDKVIQKQLNLFQHLLKS